MEQDKKQAEFTINKNVVWVKNPSDLNGEIGRDLFQRLKKTLDEEKLVDKSKKIYFVYDNSSVKINLANDGLNDFKKEVIAFENSISNLDIKICLIITNPIIRVIAGAINVFARKNIEYYKSEKETMDYIKSVVPDYIKGNQN